jgi:predicted outer membrane repeat protein
MKSESHKKGRQAGKATRASARQSSVSGRTPLRRASAPQAPFPRRLALEQLEPRLLLSADGLGLALELALPTTQLTSAATIAPAQANESSPAAVVASHELVFIDPRVPDAKELLASLVGNADPSRQFEIITLDPQRDGIVQVTAALKSRMQLDAVHFITHGTDGAIQLGGTLLDAKALAANKDLVSAWGGALKDDADLLFYGCDLASTARGRALVDWIADLTGADVAASTDKTGSAAQGSDWVLEYRAGLVQTQVAIDHATQLSWNGVLATVAVSTTADVLDGNTSSITALLTSPGADGKISLREAIIAANNTSGADTINLAGGLYQLTRTGAGENNANTGDLDIKQDLTIVGAGATTTFIDGLAADRVFDINGAAVTISGVSIQNGRETDGAGIYLNNNGSSNLTLRDVELTGNVATGNGGAIYSDRVLALDRVTIDGNTGNQGGGVYLGNNGNSNATLTNVTISGNTATTNGGGIYASGNTLNITNSTIAYNSGTGAGGIHKQGGGVATLKNTILAYNTGGNSNGAQNSLGNNIDSGNTVGLNTGLGDKINTDPLLGSLQYNGGPTKTHALLTGSPAIDAGTAVGAPATDQRGGARVGATDIGAYEFGAPAATVSGVIFHDVDGDADFTEPGTLVFENAVVRLYRDNGDGVINAADIFVGSTTTNGTGAYSFFGLAKRYNRMWCTAMS